MKVIFEPSGTHIQKGFLKVRLDLYPDVGDKTYSIHHVQVPVIPPEGYQGKVDDGGSPVDQTDYDNWVNSLPKVWQLNPALCHFVKIKETSTKAELTDYLDSIFSPTIIKTLDDSLILSNSSHLISPLMRDKSALTSEKIVIRNIEGLITSVNSRFASLVLEKASGDKGLFIEPQTITVGAAAINRGGGITIKIWSDTYTHIESSNPSAGIGTIDTAESWLDTAVGDNLDVWIAMFYLVSGTTYKVRDSESVGNLAAGSKQTSSGLSIDTEVDDLIGVSAKAGNNIVWEYENTGGSGRYWAIGEFIDPDDQATFNLSATGVLSLYGTGTEAGGPTEQAVGDGAIAVASTIGLLTKITMGAGSISTAGVLGLLTKVAVGVGSISISGALSAALTYFQNVGSGAVAIASTLGRKIALSVGGSIAIAGTLGRVIKLAVGSGAIAIAGIIGRLIKLGVGTGTTTTAGSLALKTILSVGAGSIAIAGALSASLAGIIQQVVGAGSVVISGTLGRKIIISVGAGAVTIVGALQSGLIQILYIIGTFSSALSIGHYFSKGAIPALISDISSNIKSALSIGSYFSSKTAASVLSSVISTDLDIWSSITPNLNIKSVIVEH